MCFGTGRSDDGRAGKGAGSPTAERPRIARRRAFRGHVPDSQLDEMAADMRRFRDEQHAERARRIDELVEEARRGGLDTDRVHWSMHYDMECSPATTGRAMLLEHRIVPVPPQDLRRPDDLHDELWTVIEGLAASGVFLLNTDHLPDRDLYARLYYRILDEPTRLMPPQSEAAEYIDCLHPMDLWPGSAGDLLHRRLASKGESAPARGPGIRGPRFDAGLGERDRWMPRPWA